MLVQLSRIKKSLHIKVIVIVRKKVGYLSKKRNSTAFWVLLKLQNPSNSIFKCSLKFFFRLINNNQNPSQNSAILKNVRIVVL